MNIIDILAERNRKGIEGLFQKKINILSEKKTEKTPSKDEEVNKVRNVLKIKNVEIKGADFALKIGELELSLDMEAEQASKILEDLAKQAVVIDELIKL